MQSKELEISIQEFQFIFSGHPYYLRLHFDQPIVEDGTEKATWKIEEGIVSVQIPKLNKSEHFSNLNMISRLLMRKPQASSTPKGSALVEEIDAGTVSDHRQSSDENETDWEIEQHLPSSVDVLSGGKYGFDLGFSGVFANLPEDVCYEIFEIKCNPESVSLTDRQQLRFSLEKDKFDIEHYLFDFVDEEESIAALIQQKHWYNIPNHSPECVEGITCGVQEVSIKEDLHSGSSKKASFYCERQLGELLNLKPKEKYLITHKNLVYSGVLEMVLGYCYAFRANEGDANPEMPWTVTVLCPMFVNLEATECIEVIFKNFVTRSLCYPLYRSWKFTAKACQDAVDLLKGGKSYILKALLDLKIWFDKDESRYIFSRIYLTDYCGWIQSNGFSEDHLKTMIADAEYIVSVMEKSFVEIVDLEFVESILNEDE